MSSVTENDLKKLEDLIISRFDVLEKGQVALNSRFNELDKKIAVMDEKFLLMNEKFLSINVRLDTMQASVNKIPELAEKVGELKNWRQIAFVAITATIGGIVGWFAKGGNP